MSSPLSPSALRADPVVHAPHAATARDPVGPIRRPLWDGLSIERVGWVTTIALIAASSMVWFFGNEFLDLLVSTLCVGYTMMVLFTLAGNLPIVQRGRVAREGAQIVAVVAGSALGTVVAQLVKGRSLDGMLTERLSGFVATSGIGIGFGCVVIALYFYRERDGRLRADLARMAAEFDAARAREDKQLLGARLQLLQAQVEPHFLFNTLATVQHLTTTDATRAADMLGSLIRYLRASLPQMREQSSTLGREVEMVRAYLEIQRVRMGERLHFSIDVADALLSREMPPMMLISLVENAVKHGIDPLPGGGRIDVTAARVPAGLRVTVADTGAGLSEHGGLGIGLGNIRERLATLYGGHAHLRLHENVPRGVVATIENGPRRDRDMASALIVDDEPLLREQLRVRLAALWPELDPVDEAGNGLEALDLLDGETDRPTPTVCFLDIHMPGASGLEVARRMRARAHRDGTRPPHLVFVTAYDAYAVDAFEQGAIDYLLKPFEPERLAETIVRLKDRIASPAVDDRSFDDGDMLAQLADRLARIGPATRQPLQWIKASIGSTVRLIPVDDVLYFHADDKYTRVITADGEALIRKPIKELVAELDGTRFWQIHRATIVNTRSIAGVVRGLKDSADLKLKNRPETLIVSRGYLHLFQCRPAEGRPRGPALARGSALP